jgi:ATP synthase protein I
MGLLFRERKAMKFRTESRPIRRILWWQCLAATILAVAAGLVSGIHGALSAFLGGFICVAAGFAYVITGSLGASRTAGGALRIMLRAEAVKIGLTLGLLYLVFAVYKDVAAIEFIGSFVVSVIISTMAIAIPEPKV